ncbi:helix-turn-helix domain-containing protein [Paucibacter sp. DJ4R-1]|nr:helix-turn-helix domain-containing protein [Paucibacter sp. DJ4R-1]
MEAIDPASYIRSLSCKERRALAERTRISLGHLNNLAYGQRKISALHAVRLEVATAGKVPRRLALPDEWEEIWPELAERLRSQPSANEESALGRHAA